MSTTGIKHRACINCLGQGSKLCNDCYRTKDNLIIGDVRSRRQYSKAEEVIVGLNAVKDEVGRYHDEDWEWVAQVIDEAIAGLNCLDKYRKLDSQGKLVELKIAIGTKVYYINHRNRVSSFEVNKVEECIAIGKSLQEKYWLTEEEASEVANKRKRGL